MVRPVKGRMPTAEIETASLQVDCRRLVRSGCNSICVSTFVLSGDRCFSRYERDPGLKGRMGCGKSEGMGRDDS